MAKTIWKDIPGWEGLYQVTRTGQVRSVPRYKVIGRVLKPWVNVHSGYLQVTLRNRDRIERRTVHSLVALAFIGPAHGREVRHKNAIRTDCKLSNLMYGTTQDNARDRVRDGHDHNKIKTHCPHGHEYTSENTVWHGPEKRWRRCLTCKRRDSINYLIRRESA